MEDRIDDRLEAVVRGVPGVAIAVVGSEGIRARGAVGYADLASGSPMTTHIAAPWFSMTKIATATLALRLAEERSWDLGAPVIEIVGEVGALTPSEWARRITPRHLLQHSAGLKNPLPVRWIHPASEPAPDPEAFLRALLRKNNKLRSEPGRVSSYSNLGALILAAAMVRMTGASYETLMRARILEPLGMSSTGIGHVPNVSRATGYHPRANPLRFFLPRWVAGERSGRWLALKPFAVDGPPYGGIVGTPDDAARFLQMHLADGMFNADQILASATAHEMRQITIEGKRYDFGLGWFRPANQRNVRPAFVEHLGGGAGFFNVMRAYPTAGVGAVVMGNSTKYNVDAVAEVALGFRS
jgi:CubicO group peptidase (beta-lactamase class C family)